MSGQVYLETSAVPSRINLVPAGLIGFHVRELLKTNQCTGKILAVVSNAIYLSIYLLTDLQEIIWVSPVTAPMHGRCIISRVKMDNLEPGMRFSAAGGRLDLGNRLSLVLDEGLVWKPMILRPEQVLPLPLVADLFRQTLLAAEIVSQTQEFNQSISLDFSYLYGEDHSALSKQFFMPYALNLIHEIARACMIKDISKIWSIGRDLVGLGPGLTPSGDDFLGGLLFMIFHLKSLYPREFSFNPDLISDFLVWAQSKTNSISYCILADLIQGQGPEPLHELVNSLLIGRKADSLSEVIDRLVTIGHSSGRDLLAGTLTGMLLTQG
jgi:hypothetical protein